MDLSRLPVVLRTIIEQFAIDDRLYLILAHPRRNHRYNLYGHKLIRTSTKGLLLHVLGVDRNSVVEEFVHQLPVRWSMYVPTHCELDVLYTVSFPGIHPFNVNKHKHTLLQDLEYQHMKGRGNNGGFYLLHDPSVCDIRDTLKVLTDRQLRFVAATWRRCCTRGLNLVGSYSRRYHLMRMADLLTPLIAPRQPHIPTLVYTIFTYYLQKIARLITQLIVLTLGYTAIRLCIYYFRT